MTEYNIVHENKTKWLKKKKFIRGQNETIINKGGYNYVPVMVRI